MHLQRIKITAFRNLRDFEIAFTESVDDPSVDGGQRTFNSHAVIGSNGTGKSNLIEAIINPTATSIFDMSAATRYAPPTYPAYHQEATYATGLSN